MKCINPDQHMNVATCPENTVKKLHISNRYEPMMSNRRALICVFYVRVFVSHKYEAAAIQPSLETKADARFPVRSWVMTQLDSV